MENSNYKERRIGHVFLLIFILLPADIVTGSYFAYRNYEQNYRTEVEHQLTAIAELKVKQVGVQLVVINKVASERI
jgi:hypothetical protein